MRAPAVGHRRWRLAAAIPVLLVQLATWAPTRRRDHDGTIGDEAHAARGADSDHNPWVDDPGDVSRGVVTAVDVTHDPAGGCDAGRIAEEIRRVRDPRVKYLIFNRRICSSVSVGDAAPWEWRPYRGEANPHDKHLHISLKEDARSFDDTSTWPVPLPDVTPSDNVDPVAPAEPPALDRDAAPGFQLTAIERATQLANALRDAAVVLEVVANLHPETPPGEWLRKEAILRYQRGAAADVIERAASLAGELTSAAAALDRWGYAARADRGLLPPSFLTVGS